MQAGVDERVLVGVGERVLVEVVELVEAPLLAASLPFLVSDPGRLLLRPVVVPPLVTDPGPMPPGGWCAADSVIWNSSFSTYIRILEPYLAK